MDDHIAQVAADLAKATKQHMPAMVVMVHQLRTVYDRIEAQEADIRSLREQMAKERAGIVAWLRVASQRADNLSQKNAFEYAAGMIEAQQDKEPTS